MCVVVVALLLFLMAPPSSPVLAADVHPATGHVITHIHVVLAFTRGV